MSTALILKALIALLPVIVLIIVLHRLDSQRLLGTPFIVFMYLAGGAIAMVCYFVNAFALQSFATDFGFYTRYIGPLVEETLKASVIVYLFRSNRVGFLIDAGILGFTVGAGFSFIENLYYLNAAHDAHYGVWVVRGFGTAIMHGGATALFAIIAQTLTERHLKMNPLLYLPGLIVAFLLHSVFNHFPISPILSTAVTLAILADMQSKLSGPAAQEMVRYFCLHTELVLNAESALRPQLQFTAKDMWEIHLLEHEAHSLHHPQPHRQT
jgi:RsiW-degrading membrane proteinase PrsW (M82 family)